MMNPANLTPGMQQYMKIKQENPDCIVLFRMGDFYETFYEDAKIAAKELDIVLTSRGKGEKKAPLAGIPYHAVEPYIAKLVKKGYKVAIVEQVEDPKLAKGLVKRELVRIITPGTVLESTMLDERSNNYLMSINKEGRYAGIALADISTGELMATEVDSYDKLLSEITKHNPAEIIIPLSLENSEFAKELSEMRYVVNTLDDRHYWQKSAESLLKNQFGVSSLQGYGIEDKPLIVSSIGALIAYLKQTQKNNLNLVGTIKTYSSCEYMILDYSTQRNLELLKNLRENTTRGTLLEVLDKTSTPMGSRLLKKWIVRPLMDIKKINERLDAVEELVENHLLRLQLREYLSKINDIERLIVKVKNLTANGRDLIALKQSLAQLPEIKEVLKDSRASLLKEILSSRNITNLVDLIEKAIVNEPPLSIRDGGIIKKGYSKELDDLKSISKDSKRWIAELEEKERQKTGIKSLKIKYNKVFGYFIEVTKPNLHLVPENYIRKQTQVNSERFITPELKEKEDIILNAEEKIVALEYNLFMELLKQISAYTEDIIRIAHLLAVLDVIQSFATVSSTNRYARPQIHEDFDLYIIQGRHPVIETLTGEFVPNDCKMSRESSFHIITGPNMAGKSTFMRQVALINILAQIGCFVPATQASISIVDRIFTRVGAHDDLTSGQSTFMVEMNETANILNNATENSLIILDEIGRGTSTYDGVSLAWSVVEYICQNIKAKTLFATHYHQLNRLAEMYENIENYNIAVDEQEDKIVFLRKILKGGTDKSYGIQVARLAGLPKKVIDRALEIMSKLEMEDVIGSRLDQKKLEKQFTRTVMERKSKPGKETQTKLI